MNIALVVFDMAGTTVQDDDTVNICLKQALETGGIVASRTEINEVMGEPKPVAIAKLVSRGRELPADGRDQEVIEIHERFKMLMLTHYRKAPEVRAVEGAENVFRELKESGVRVALDTGFSRVIVDAILERLGWVGNELVDVTVASDEVPRGRPHGDLIERAMGLIGVDDPKCVAKVGGTPADLLSCDAAGCGWIIGITTGSHTRAELERYPHTHLIERLDELPAAVLGARAITG
jgi:phosphonatase-like hydrolase